MSENFHDVRREFLSGKEDLPEIKDNVIFHTGLDCDRNASYVLSRAKHNNRIVLQGNYGFPSLQEHRAFYKELANAISDKDMIFTLTIDTADEKTRTLQTVSLKEMREFVIEAPGPVQIRSGKSDQRLLVEKALASGVTDIVGGAITNSAYSFERISLEKGVGYWKYVDKLIALYWEHGVTINKEISLPLTGNLIPPSLQLALIILDGLISWENGVKSLTLAYNQGGNLCQDISAMRVLPILFQEYLKKLSQISQGSTRTSTDNPNNSDNQYNQDNEVGNHNIPDYSTTLATWSAGFPDSPDKGYAIITMAGIVAALGKADKIITSSPEKGKGDIDPYSYIQGSKTTVQSIEMASCQSNNNLVCSKEYQHLYQSVKSIVDDVLKISDSEKISIAQAVLTNFNNGKLDVPFSSMIENQGHVLPFRAVDGSVRYFDCGNLPLPRQIIYYNEKSLRERAAREQREPAFQMVIDDIYAAGKGQLI